VLYHHVALFNEI
jgi:hypothetical protein